MKRASYKKYYEEVNRVITEEEKKELCDFIKKKGLEEVETTTNPKKISSILFRYKLGYHLNAYIKLDFNSKSAFFILGRYYRKEFSTEICYNKVDSSLGKRIDKKLLADRIKKFKALAKALDNAFTSNN